MSQSICILTQHLRHFPLIPLHFPHTINTILFSLMIQIYLLLCYVFIAMNLFIHYSIFLFLFLFYFSLFYFFIYILYLLPFSPFSLYFFYYFTVGLRVCSVDVQVSEGGFQVRQVHPPLGACHTHGRVVPNNCRYVRPSMDITVCLCVCLPMSLCLSVCLCHCLSLCLSICLSVPLFVRLSVCLRGININL